jgi:predicted lipoprotein
MMDWWRRLSIHFPFKKFMKTSIYCLLLFCVSAFMSGCGGDDREASTEDNAKDRQEILAHWADNIIKPGYANFKSKLDAMSIKAEIFTAGPTTETLTGFRQSWKETYIEWQKVELFEFGPADKYTMRNFFNIYPTDIAGISASINDPAISLDVPSSYARQGFPALDYLLNGTGNTEAEVLAYFTHATEGTKRLAYVTKLVSRMNTILTNVVTEWNGSYRDTFIAKTGLDIGSSMGLVVNAYVLNYERYIRSGKFGIPAGALVAGGGTVQPEKVEAYYQSDISLSLAQTANQASRDFFNGKNPLTGEEGPSFKTYLNALEAKDASTGTLLSSLIDSQFALAQTEMGQLSEDFALEAQSNTQGMLDVFNAMQGVVRMLKVDMTSAMSITITYTDNDGD